MIDVSLKCSCGKVTGVVKEVSPESGNHIVCYCKDCQAFANYLERGQDVFDEYGGTDIFQTTPNKIEIHQGNDQLRCVRLRPKGLYRWYADCCKTPIGNMMSAGMPFIGLIHNFMDDEGVRNNNLGPVTFYAFAESATSTPPDNKIDKGFPIGFMWRFISRTLLARLRGQHKPNAFFNDSGKPVVEPIIL